MISELMKCSLYDVFKTLRKDAQPMPLRRSLRYAIQFAQVRGSGLGARVRARVRARAG